MKFTDALNDYLKAKKERDYAKNNYDGDDFSYYFYDECKRLDDAEDALNKFFEPKEQP